MSSQGPKVTGGLAYNTFRADPAAGSPSLTAGRNFTSASLRDGSDWIAYKKQTLILNESKPKLAAAHPEIRYGNNYRIQYLLGRYKNSPSAGTCSGCSSTTALISGGVD